jgi:hypothetical protein
LKKKRAPKRLGEILDRQLQGKGKGTPLSFLFALHEAWAEIIPKPLQDQVSIAGYDVEKGRLRLAAKDSVALHRCSLEKQGILVRIIQRFGPDHVRDIYFELEREVDPESGEENKGRE